MKKSRIISILIDTTPEQLKFKFMDKVQKSETIDFENLMLICHMFVIFLNGNLASKKPQKSFMRGKDFPKTIWSSKHS